MKISNLLKSMWNAISWYSRRVFNLLLGKAMILPTKQVGNDILINKDRVTNAVKFEVNGIKFIFCLVDNEPAWLFWSLELETWFVDSIIYILGIKGEPEIKCNPEDVKNIPEKYFQENEIKGKLKPT